MHLQHPFVGTQVLSGKKETWRVKECFYACESTYKHTKPTGNRSQGCFAQYSTKACTIQCVSRLQHVMLSPLEGDEHINVKATGHLSYKAAEHQCCKQLMCLMWIDIAMVPQPGFFFTWLNEGKRSRYCRITTLWSQISQAGNAETSESCCPQMLLENREIREQSPTKQSRK